MKRKVEKSEQEWKQALTPEQTRHLTEHGVNQNEDGTYSWKFDQYVRLWPAYDMTREAIARLWSRITCPTLLVHGLDGLGGRGRVRRVRGRGSGDLEGGSRHG